MIKITALPFLILTLFPEQPQTEAQFDMLLGYCCPNTGNIIKYSADSCVKAYAGTPDKMYYFAYHNLTVRTANNPTAITAAVEYLVNEATRLCSTPS